MPAAVAPEPVEEVSDPQEEEPSTPPPTESVVAIGGLPMVQSSSGSFHFMQESELEASQTPFEDGAEWVERSDAADHQAEQRNHVPPALELEETNLVNGHMEDSLVEVIGRFTCYFHPVIQDQFLFSPSLLRPLQLTGQPRMMLASHPLRVCIPNSAHLALQRPSRQK